jgi:hypothetical protein
MLRSLSRKEPHHFDGAQAATQCGSAIQTVTISYFFHNFYPKLDVSRKHIKSNATLRNTSDCFVFETVSNL